MKAFLMLLGLSVLSACSSATPLKPIARVEPQVRAEVPFEVAVVQERNDGVDLEVHANLLSRFSWDPARVAIRVTGLSQGEKTQQFGSALQDLLATEVSQLEAGKQYLFSLVIPGTGLSDYQLEVLWGSDAEDVLGKGNHSGSQVPGISLSQIDVVRRMNCDEGPACLVYHELRGILENTTRNTANSVVVGVGYLERQAEELDLSNEIPENETPVTLPGEPLLPGEKRPVRVQLESALTEEQDKLYVPTMRILAIEPQGTGKRSG